MKFCATLILLCTFGYLSGQDKLQVSFGNLTARDIGPAVMSGRISCLDGLHKKPETFYIGAANGGVWKTNSAGANFDPIFDDHTQSIGDLCIDQAHPDTVWVGTGEPWVRNSVSVGDGIYYTKNGGKTWSHAGLKETERISKLLIHPSRSQIIYVAAQGPLWNASTHRGVYKTSDFGTSWEKIQFIDENTGCADLTMHPNHPDTLIASFWDHRRTPAFFRSGGPGSGLFRTFDGGKSWHKLTDGLPAGILGRMAVEYAPSNGDIVYLTVEAEKKEDKGLYKSLDGGNSFKKINGDFGTTVRPFYFSRLTVDPTNSEKLFKCGLNLIISENGGESFRTVGSGVHSDIHDIWVPKTNPNYVVIGTDGGGYRSLDGGQLFEMFMNLPLSQFYHISVDNAKPYHIYGGLQDNGSWFGPSYSPGGIENKDWSLSNWGDGFYSLRHPELPHIIYSESQGGEIVRYDDRDGQSKNIKPLPEDDEVPYRYNWNTPVHLGRNNPDRIYVGAQFLFKSEDRGESWERISPDLTTNDTSRQKQARSGGLSIDNSTAENNTTIYAIAESPLDEKIIWVGTDDGNLQVTQDGGQSWNNVAINIPALPPFTWCTFVEPSTHDPHTLYVTFDGHKQGDMATYLYKTSDLGKSWQSLVADQLRGYAHVIRQDLVNPDLLFAGTEFGLFISLDDGISWKRFQNNMPPVSVRSLAFQERENSLVAGTHGRGIYILDDITPLRQVTSAMVDSTLHFFDMPASEVTLARSGSPFGGAGNFVGANPSSSAQIAYYMKKRHTFGKMRLEVFDAEDNLITEIPPGKSGGINIVRLPLRKPPPKAAPTRNRMALFGSLITPSLLEGDYRVKITKGTAEYNHVIKLKVDSNINYPIEDRTLQQQTLQKLYDMTEQLGHIYFALQDMHKQAQDMRENHVDLNLGQLADSTQRYKESLVSLEGDFYVDEGTALREEISTLYLHVSQYPGKPSDRQIKKTALLQEKMAVVKDRFTTYEQMAEEINQKLSEKGAKSMTWKTFEDFRNP